jgi:hypothetical protein
MRESLCKKEMGATLVLNLEEDELMNKTGASELEFIRQ